MGLALTLHRFLKLQHIPFELINHQYSEGSVNTANAAKISLNTLAKGVVFRDEDLHYTMAVLPAQNKVRRYTLNQIFDRHMVLAEEEELDQIFRDCKAGAIPPLGQAYGMNIIWDESFNAAEEVYLEAGDHRHLVKIRGDIFRGLMQAYLCDKISTPQARKRAA